MSISSASPTQSQAQQAVGQFLQSVLPPGVPIIIGFDNRVPEPPQGVYVQLTPIRFTRLATNADDWQDVRFVGSIADTTLTVTEVDSGAITVNATLFGIGVAAASTIGRQLTGASGGVGTYAVSPSQTIGSRVLSCGAKTMMQSAEMTVQIDVHSVDTTASDLAQTISTALRDDFATAYFSALPPPLNAIAPFYADNPRDLSFVNAEKQYEWRFMIDAHFGINQIVSVPQQYADTAMITPVSVEATYPP